MYAPGRKLNWARVYIYQVAYRERWKDDNCQGRWYNADLGYACFQEKCNRVCIARAAINESVCEDSHAEHMQFATAAVFTPILAEVIL